MMVTMISDHIQRTIKPQNNDFPRCPETAGSGLSPRTKGV
jgi:hypothetical protein